MSEDFPKVEAVCQNCRSLVAIHPSQLLPETWARRYCALEAELKEAKRKADCHDPLVERVEYMERELAKARKEIEFWKEGTGAKVLDHSLDEARRLLTAVTAERDRLAAENRELKSQDEIHWKIRRSLLEQRDELKARVEEAIRQLDPTRDGAMAPDVAGALEALLEAAFAPGEGGLDWEDTCSAVLQTLRRREGNPSPRQDKEEKPNG